MLSLSKHNSNQRQYISLLFLVVTSLFLSGCGSKLTVNTDLIKQYTPPVQISEDESLVYVIRQSSMLGAARGLYVALNDKIVANVGSGTYCYFTVKKGINTINLEQVVPFGYARVDDRSGEELFFYFEMTTGKFTELGKNLGMTAVMQSSESGQKKLSKDNIGYAAGIFNPNLIGLYLMKDSDQPLKPDAENAVITFIRPQDFVKDMGLGIWSDTAFVGNLKGESYFQLKVAPGSYSFFGKSEHYSVLQAEVEAGKHYYVEVSANTGWSQVHVKLVPVKADVNQKTIDKWLKNSKRVVLDQTEIDELIQKRLDLALPLLEEVKKKAESGQIETRDLQVEDGRLI